MQAARLLEPRPRTHAQRRLIEAARALQLEWRYGKAGVLGIWLTLAPYGGNLEGVRAGSPRLVRHIRPRPSTRRRRPSSSPCPAGPRRCAPTGIRTPRSACATAC